ncbi:hypothetical protein [Falsigemmobacter faecalis]|uniref:Lipoprotein n=1 Tax=Falsigemmobacter faecalis TaxID=2488730 RepID=A0A3P3DVY6_9RHOB|nr:hypothetical protein [Falsigemmobacter faecalis]RRH78407.1 hypothetical protein EG244_00180 [Falsigemmobacter faecalis]
MRAAFALLGLLALMACRGEEPAAAPSFAPLAEAEVACTRTGGEFLKAAGGKARVCVQLHKDSGKQCRAALDCEGECLARSGTCAPASPLFGCHEILMENGVRAKQCRD